MMRNDAKYLLLGNQTKTRVNNNSLKAHHHSLSPNNSTARRVASDIHSAVPFRLIVVVAFDINLFFEPSILLAMWQDLPHCHCYCAMMLLSSACLLALLPLVDCCFSTF